MWMWCCAVIYKQTIKILCTKCTRVLYLLVHIHIEIYVSRNAISHKLNARKCHLYNTDLINKRTHNKRSPNTRIRKTTMAKNSLFTPSSPHRYFSADFFFLLFFDVFQGGFYVLKIHSQTYALYDTRRTAEVYALRCQKR